LIFDDKIPFGFFPKDLDLNHFVHLNTMSVTIFDNKFMEKIYWLDIKVASGIPTTNNYLIYDNIGNWCDHIERQNIWN
jgi:hypothetical protein